MYLDARGRVGDRSRQYIYSVRPGESSDSSGEHMERTHITL